MLQSAWSPISLDLIWWLNPAQLSSGLALGSTWEQEKSSHQLCQDLHCAPQARSVGLSQLLFSVGSNPEQERRGLILQQHSLHGIRCTEGKVGVVAKTTFSSHLEGRSWLLLVGCINISRRLISLKRCPFVSPLCCFVNNLWLSFSLTLQWLLE